MSDLRQIQTRLTEEQLRYLDKRASATHTTRAGLIREAVDVYRMTTEHPRRRGGIDPIPEAGS